MPSREPETTFVLWRQDDNGNRFEVARYRTREEAEQARQEFESRGHKQYYEILPVNEVGGHDERGQNSQ